MKHLLWVSNNKKKRLNNLQTATVSPISLYYSIIPLHVNLVIYLTSKYMMSLYCNYTHDKISQVYL